MTKIIMHGYQGKMGQTIFNLCQKNDKFEIVAGIDPTPSALSVPFPTYCDINDCDMPSSVIIDFSTAKAVPRLLNYAKDRKIPIVLCTTGLSDETLNLVNETSKYTAVFKSANMSLGVSLVASLLKQASKLLTQEGFDIEIIEKHHNQKIDAPSGTALFLADSINSALDEKMNYIYDRSNISEKRSTKEIGIHAIRGGTIVGDHEVIFAGHDEIITLGHTALSKDIFAIGALKAAQFISDKPAGLYDMQHLTHI